MQLIYHFGILIKYALSVEVMSILGQFAKVSSICAGIDGVGNMKLIYGTVLAE